VSKPALLALADGTLFHGISIGCDGSTIGEVVFNTAMTGYQEILTDPSYTKQMVTLTYPHIGNYGVSPEDMESNSVFAAGLIIRDLPLLHSNFRSDMSLGDYLVKNNVVAIADIDTRKLTRILRSKGAQPGCIVTGENIDAAAAVEKAKSFGSMAGQDLAKVVSCKESFAWTTREWKLGAGYTEQTNPEFHVVAYDFGVKFNILRMLAERGCKLTVVPAQTPASEVLALKPDGVFLSNGPGDPEPCDYAIAAIKDILAADLPVFALVISYWALQAALKPAR
jgi:carbamoyl-phosphate synthase small subunit